MRSLRWKISNLIQNDLSMRNFLYHNINKYFYTYNNLFCTINLCYIFVSNYYRRLEL